MPSKLHPQESLQLCFRGAGGRLCWGWWWTCAPCPRQAERVALMLLLCSSASRCAPGMRLRQSCSTPGQEDSRSPSSQQLARQPAGPAARHALLPMALMSSSLLAGIRSPASQASGQAGPGAGVRRLHQRSGARAYRHPYHPGADALPPQRRHRLMAATALDFTLPVIQKSGGIQVVPVGIVSGFILSLLGPILILGSWVIEPMDDKARHCCRAFVDELSGLDDETPVFRCATDPHSSPASMAKRIRIDQQQIRIRPTPRVPFVASPSAAGLAVTTPVPSPVPPFAAGRHHLPHRLPIWRSAAR